VDYLLEDEEEPHRSRGKVILIVAAVALAAGFGYMHWKQGGFDWLSGGDKKPAVATTQASDAAPSGDSGATTGGATPGAGTAPAAGSVANPVESGSPQTGPAQNSSQAAPSQSSPTENAVTQSAGQTNTAQPSPGQIDAGDSGAPATAPQAASSDSESQSAPAEANPRQKAHKPSAAKPSAAKPAAAKPAAAKPVDSVTEAERYIYGRGVAQDCDHGLRVLKPAAGQSNVKAMISLGALYSTGTCTPRDLPTAYRWFAMALHKEPDNQALQDDLQKLWSQMTQPERQLAIKLSQ
jgi:hypothetical protein